MVQDGAFSHKIEYIQLFKEIFNPEGHPNRFNSSKVTAIFAKGWSCIGKGPRLQPAQQACF